MNECGIALVDIQSEMLWGNVGGVSVGQSDVRRNAS